MAQAYDAPLDTSDGVRQQQQRVMQLTSLLTAIQSLAQQAAKSSVLPSTDPAGLMQAAEGGFDDTAVQVSAGLSYRFLLHARHGRRVACQRIWSVPEQPSFGRPVKQLSCVSTAYALTVIRFHPPDHQMTHTSWMLHPRVPLPPSSRRTCTTTPQAARAGGCPCILKAGGQRHAGAMWRRDGRCLGVCRKRPPWRHQPACVLTAQRPPCNRHPDVRTPHKLVIDRR